MTAWLDACVAEYEKDPALTPFSRVVIPADQAMKWGISSWVRATKKVLAKEAWDAEEES